MNHHRLKLCVASVGLHFFIIWLLVGGTPFLQGASHGMPSQNTTAKVLRAEIISNKGKQQQELESIPTRNEFGGQLNELAGIDYASRSLKVAEAAASGNLRQAKLPIQNTQEREASVQEYIAMGHLTRLPFPITEIDLDDASALYRGAIGLISLLILIEEDGSVTEVIASVEQEELRALSEHVAEHFMKARFAPGEVNGKAVRSKLQIAVVSEQVSSN